MWAVKKDVYTAKSLASFFILFSVVVVAAVGGCVNCIWRALKTGRLAILSAPRHVLLDGPPGEGGEARNRGSGAGRMEESEARPPTGPAKGGAASRLLRRRAGGRVGLVSCASAMRSRSDDVLSCSHDALLLPRCPPAPTMPSRPCDYRLGPGRQPGRRPKGGPFGYRRSTWPVPLPGARGLGSARGGAPETIVAAPPRPPPPPPAARPPSHHLLHILPCFGARPAKVSAAYPVAAPLGPR